MALSSNSVVLPQVPRVGLTHFTEGVDVAGTLKTIFTPGANGSKVGAILATSEDGTADHLVNMYLTRSAEDFLLNAKNVPMASGAGGSVPSVDMFGDTSLVQGLPLDADGQPYLFLEPDDLLKAKFTTALTAGKRLTLMVIGADF